MTIRAVLFDLDDTLIHHPYGHRWDEVMIEQAARLRRCSPTELLGGFNVEEFVTDFWAEFREELPEPEQPAQAPFEENRWKQGQRLLSRMLEQDVGPAFAELAAPWWHELFLLPAASYGRHPFFGAHETLRLLAAQGYALGVVTNRLTPATYVQLELDGLGFDDLFSAVSCAGESGFRKPHWRVFEDALRTLGLLPEEVVMVGDSYELDIAPARAMGMTTVLKANGDRTRHSPGAHHQIGALGDLLHLLPRARP